MSPWKKKRLAKQFGIGIGLPLLSIIFAWLKYSGMVSWPWGIVLIPTGLTMIALMGVMVYVVMLWFAFRGQWM